MDTGYYNETNNLFNKLMESCVINNNIFGYEMVPKINLVYFLMKYYFTMAQEIQKKLLDYL